MKNRSRLSFFDSAKGFAIFSVILAHLNTFLDLENLHLAYIIQSYFMPMFFFISGYFCYKQSDLDYLLFLKKKFKQRIIPYVTSCLGICIVYSLIFNVNLFNRYIFDSSKGGYWFLIVLFVFCNLYVICHKITCSIKSNIRKNMLFFLLLIFVYLIFCVLPLLVSVDTSYLFSLPELRRFFPAFAFGMLFKILSSSIDIWNYKSTLLSAIIYFSLLIYGYNDKTIIGFFIWMIVSIAACVFYLNLFKKINIFMPIFISYGRNSLGIYIYHYIFIYILKAIVPVSLFSELPTGIIMFVFIVLTVGVAELSELMIRLTYKLKLKFLIGA